MLGRRSDLCCHPLELFIIIGLSQEILTRVYEFITDRIRFDTFLKQILSAASRVVQYRFYLANLRSLTP